MDTLYRKGLNSHRESMFLRSNANASTEILQLTGQENGKEIQTSLQLNLISCPQDECFLLLMEEQWMEYLMGFVFIVQHWIINCETACHIDLSFN